MARIVRRQLGDILDTFSSIAPLDAGSLEVYPPEDLFLCALGFEPRCLSLPGSLKKGRYRAQRAVYFKYATNIEDNNVNLGELEERLRGIAPDVRPLDADSADFSSGLRAILDSIKKETRGDLPRVTLDVSVAANRLLLRSLKILLEYDVSLRVIYSEAAIYHPTREEYAQDPTKWERDDAFGLERGVSGVMPSVDHPGHALDPLPDFLILFPSFKPERSKAVIGFVDPSLLSNPRDKVVWLLGVPHHPDDLWRFEAMREINGIGDSAPLFEVSTFDYKDTLRVLERLHAGNSERYTITLSPLGSKMQALGTALFCYMHPDVRVIFSTPKEYNAAQYSEGCKAIWVIDFGDLPEVRGKLDDVGSLTIEG